MGQMLEQKGLVSFSPHYLIWVCQFGSDADECKTQCIKQGAYCCPDPDDDIHEGYSGRDVLLVGNHLLAIGASMETQDFGYKLA